jgi:hypothetical protein
VLAKNRRGGAENADRIDDEVLGIRVDAADGDRRIALVLNYAVHPIWLRPRSRVFSQDLAGALERSEAIGDGAMVLFVNGAEGDISPRVRPEPDAATAIADFEAAVAEDLSPRATSDLLDIVPVVVRRDMGSAHAYVTWGPRARFAPAARSPFGEGVVGFGAAVLSLPANVAIWGLGVPDVRAGFTFDGSVGLVASLDSYLDGTVFSFGAVRLETPEATAAIVWMPVEATHTVGRAIREAAAVRGADPVFLFGLTNGAMGYCCSHDEYFEGGYESLSTLFGPDTSVLVREACEAALDAAR